jgi:hypothetical protein
MSAILATEPEALKWIAEGRQVHELAKTGASEDEIMRALGD